MHVSPVTEITARPLIENSMTVTTSQGIQINWSMSIGLGGGGNSLNPAIYMYMYSV